MPTATPIVMNVGATDIAQLRALGSPRYQEVIRVYWGSTVRNYANTSINNLTGFSGSGAVFGIIYPRILKDQWIEFKMSSLLEDDTITLDLTDPDEAINVLARASGEGQRVEVYSYYPEVTASNPNGLAVLRWWGLMKRPDASERYTFRAKVAAGFRSPNLTLPKRFQYSGCQATFGGLVNPDTGLPYMTTLAQRAANACPYNIDLPGGTIGVPGFTSCPRDSVAPCQARLGAEYYRWYLGFPNIGAYSTVQGKSFTFIARTEVNQTIVKKRLPVVYGFARLTDIEPIATQNQISSNPKYEARGFLRTLYNICEGPTYPVDTSFTAGQYGQQNGMYYLKVNNRNVGQDHDWKFQGIRGESSQLFGDTRVIGYQLTAQVLADLNYAEFQARYPSEAKASVTVSGMSNLRVYTTPTAYTEAYSTNRAWCLLDLLSNKRYGLGYDIGLFYIQDWLNLATWFDTPIPMLLEDGSTANRTRSTLNVAITERPAAQIVNDICASGRLSLPFFFQGKIRVVGLGLETLTSLLTFSDETTHGFNPNIRKDSLRWSVTGDEEVVNQVKVTYDEFLFNPNGDTNPWDVYERSIVLDDQDAQLKAGATLGDQTTRVVDKSFTAYGVKDFPEAGRITTLFLDLGEHEQGGLKNNLTATFETTGHNADAFQLHQFRLIKVLNAGLNVYAEPDGTIYDTFRVKQLRRKSDGWLEVTVQAYPKSYMAKAENGTYVVPLSWATTESNYGRVITRTTRASLTRTVSGLLPPRRARTIGRGLDRGIVIVLPSGGTEQVETATVIGTISTSGAATVVLTAADVAGSPKTMAINVRGGVAQVETATVVGAIATSGNVTVVVTAAGMTGSPRTLNVPVVGGITQVETATVNGSIDTTGNAAVIVTAAGLTGSPKTYTVPVLVTDTDSTVAGKMRVVLAADGVLTALYTVSGSGAAIVLTRVTPAANDTTLNIGTGNGAWAGLGSSCAGLTTEPVSANTLAGTATGDDYAAVASKIRTAMSADGNITAMFAVGGAFGVSLTRLVPAANDATLNISIANGTCTGLTTTATSANTRAGQATGDTAAEVAARIRSFMGRDDDIFAKFGVTGTGADIVLTHKGAAANDGTLNISIANGTCTGLTSAPTSANTTPGVAPS